MGGLSRRGYKDWLIQRVSALLIGGYALFLIIYLVCMPHISFMQWTILFNYTWMQVLTLLVVIAVCWHAWIGLWTVFTDYIKCGFARVFLQAGLCILLVSYIIWCVSII